MLTLTCFPLMGVGEFTVPALLPGGPVTLSQYVSDLVINPHPRFATLTANIRERKGGLVDIRVPLFRDKYTGQEESVAAEGCHSSSNSNSDSNSDSDNNSSNNDNNKRNDKNTNDDSSSDRSSGSRAAASNDGSSSTSARPPVDHNKDIHMDAMAFGMGCCCLQVTFQARSLEEARCGGGGGSRGGRGAIHISTSISDLSVL